MCEGSELGRSLAEGLRSCDQPELGKLARPSEGEGGASPHSKGFRSYPKCRGTPVKVLRCLAVLV